MTNNTLWYYLLFLKNWKREKKTKNQQPKQKAYRKLDVSLYNDLLSAWQTLFWHLNKFALQQWQNICQKILFLAQIFQASYSTNRIALFCTVRGTYYILSLCNWGALCSFGRAHHFLLVILNKVNYICNWTGIWELRPWRIQIQHGSKRYFSFVWMSSVASPGKVLKQSSQTLLKVNFMLEKLRFLLSSFYFHGSQFKNKINEKIENRTEKKRNKCFVQWVPNQGTLIPPSPPLALLFLEASILSSKTIYHPEPPYPSLQPH